MAFEADDALVRQVDDWWHAHRLPHRADALRKLVVGALRSGMTLDATMQPVLERDAEMRRLQLLDSERGDAGVPKER